MEREPDSGFALASAAPPGQPGAMKIGAPLSALLAFFLVASLAAQDNSGDLASLAKIRPDVKSRRVSSYDRTGGNADNVSGAADGAKVNLMDVHGPGIIRHIWITLAPGAEKLACRNNVCPCAGLP